MNENCVIMSIPHVILVSSESRGKGWRSYGLHLNYQELIFNFSGHAQMYFDSEELEIRANSIRYLPAGDTRRYDVYRDEAGECIDVFFNSDKPLFSGAFVLECGQNEKPGVLFRRLFACWTSREAGWEYECMSLLYRILSEMQKTAYVPSAHEEKIRPAAEELHRGFLQRDYTVPELAAICGMSESYFKRLFALKYGMPPKRYMVQLKIDHACELLRLGRYTVSQVAAMCRFSDVYFFSRQFKQVMGVSPRVFMNKYKSNE